VQKFGVSGLAEVTRRITIADTLADHCSLPRSERGSIAAESTTLSFSTLPFLHRLRHSRNRRASAAGSRYFREGTCIYAPQLFDAKYLLKQPNFRLF
jgi:hypothetical protein